MAQMKGLAVDLMQAISGVMVVRCGCGRANITKYANMISLIPQVSYSFGYFWNKAVTKAIF